MYSIQTISICRSMPLFLFCFVCHTPTWQTLGTSPTIRYVTSFTTCCKSHVHCKFNTMVAILLYVNDVVLLYKFGASLQRILKALLLALKSIYLRLKSWSGLQKKDIGQSVFYLGKDPIEITHEYKYFGTNFYSHWYFEPSSKRRRIASMKALMSTLR